MSLIYRSDIYLTDDSTSTILLAFICRWRHASSDLYQWQGYEDAVSIYFENLCGVTVVAHLRKHVWRINLIGPEKLQIFFFLLCSII